MVTAKKVAAKKAAGGTAAPRKAPPRKVAAKKTVAATASVDTVGFSEGDVVSFTAPAGGVQIIGRVCRVLNFDRYCVQFPDIGCRRVPGSALQAAPGASAPACGSCTDC
jgi:hypothetical protein